MRAIFIVTATVLGFIQSSVAQCQGESTDIPVLRIPNPLEPDNTVLDSTRAVTCTKDDLKKSLASKIIVDSPFKVTMTCTGVTNLACAYAKASIEAALSKISKAFDFRKQVSVNAKFRSFCAGRPSGCDLNNVLGQASPASLYLANRVGEQTSVWYPQGLVKQLITTRIVQFDEYDIFAEFNSDAPFYYPSNPNSAMTKKQYDFEYIAAHELLHGLGFISFWRMYNSDLNPQITKPVFMPPVKCTAAPNIMDSRCESWFGLSVFDKFLYDSQTNASMFEMGKSITKYTVRNITFGKLTEAMSKVSSLSIPMNSALKLVTSESKLVFQDGNGTVIKLYAPAEFKPSSSISHVDTDTYKASSDFLMAHDASSKLGVTFKNMINKPDIVGCLGPNTVQMMNAIGWPAPDSAPQVLNIQTSLELKSDAAHVFAAQGFAMLFALITLIY